LLDPMSSSKTVLVTFILEHLKCYKVRSMEARLIHGVLGSLCFKCWLKNFLLNRAFWMRMVMRYR
jgi:hypothetical protein